MGEPLKDKKKNRFPSYPNVVFYDEETVKSAVEWLKEEINIEDADEKTARILISIYTKIDQAFPDINTNNSEKARKE